MKKILYTLLVPIFLASCDSGVHIHPQFSDKEYDEMGKAVEGVYQGYYRVIVEKTDGNLGVKDSIPATIKVTGWDEHEITFFDCPISMYAYSFEENTPMRHIFGNLGNMDITSNYFFRRWGDQSQEIALNHQLPTSISISGEYEGITHRYKLNLDDMNVACTFQKEDFSRNEILRGKEIRLSIDRMSNDVEHFEPYFVISFYANE